MSSQYFNGKEFVCVTGGKYYREKGVFTNLMHRYVWAFYNGDIPEDCDIHHKDGDPSNNNIENLECLPKTAHKRLHADTLSEDKREWYRVNLQEKARPKAIEWHKSEEGRAWHKELITKQHKLGVFKHELICTNCGKSYVGEKHHENNFCSNACKSAYRRKSGVDLVPAVCVTCGKYFKTNKLRPAKTCSRSCANRYRAKVRRGN